MGYYLSESVLHICAASAPNVKSYVYLPGPMTIWEMLVVYTSLIGTLNAPNVSTWIKTCPFMWSRYGCSPSINLGCVIAWLYWTHFLHLRCNLEMNTSRHESTWICPLCLWISKGYHQHRSEIAEHQKPFANRRWTWNIHTSSIKEDLHKNRYVDMHGKNIAPLRQCKDRNGATWAVYPSTCDAYFITRLRNKATNLQNSRLLYDINIYIYIYIHCC